MSEVSYYQCRLCLKNTEFAYSLFNSDVIDIVESFTSIKIDENDNNLPSFCCAPCLDDIYLVYKIRSRIIESDRLLREVQQNQDEIQKNIAEEQQEHDCDNSMSPAQDTFCDENSDFIIQEPDNPISGEDSIVHIETSPDFDKSSLTDEPKEEPPDIDSTEQPEEQPFSKTYKCTQCKMKFESKKIYQQHISSSHSDIVSVCKLCGTHVLKSNYKRHMEVHKGTPQVCELCGAVAKNAESLRGHMFYMHKSTAEQYMCKVCNKYYRYKYKFELHMRKAHGGDRSHICEVCGKSFYTARDVNRHIRMTHMKLRPYICDYCNKGFSSSYARQTHVRQHTNEKPFKCEVCAEGFRQRVSLKTHLKSKHGCHNNNRNNNKNKNGIMAFKMEAEQAMLMMTSSMEDNVKVDKQEIFKFDDFELENNVELQDYSNVGGQGCLV